MRVLHLDALACPRCSSPSQRVPMTVLAFLSDPDVVYKILRHLGLPICAPALAPARSTTQPLAFELPDVSTPQHKGFPHGQEATAPEPPIRPPP